MSILKEFGIPDTVGVLLFTLALVLLLASYLGGVELGSIKIPSFRNSTRRQLRWLGPLFVIGVVVLFLPIIPPPKLVLVDKRIAPDGTIEVKLLNKGHATAFVTRANFSTNAVCVLLPQNAYLAALNPSHEYVAGLSVLPPPIILRLPLSQVVKESEADFFTVRVGIDQSFLDALTRKRWEILERMKRGAEGKGHIFMVGPDETRVWNARFEQSLTRTEKDGLSYLRIRAPELDVPRDVCVDFSLSVTYNRSELESVGRFVFCDGYSRHFGVKNYSIYSSPWAVRNQQLAHLLLESRSEKNDLAAAIIQAVLSANHSPGA